MNILNNIFAGIRNRIKKGIRNWNLFWFSPLDTISLSSFRLCFATVLFVHYIIRCFNFRLFFFENGLLSPVEAYYLGRLEFQSLDLVIRSDTLLMGLYIALCISTLSLLLGLGGRRLSFFIFLLHIVFLKRNPSIATSADHIATFFLLYLSLTNPSRQLNILQYIKNKGKEWVLPKPQNSFWLDRVGARCLQIHSCIILLYSGLEKLKSEFWWKGNALSKALLEKRNEIPFIDFSFLKSDTLFSKILLNELFPLICFSLILFELYFPVLVWVPGVLRKWSLRLGVLFFIIAGVCLNMYFHFLMLLPVLLLFCSPDRLRKFFRKFKR